MHRLEHQQRTAIATLISGARYKHKRPVRRFSKEEKAARKLWLRAENRENRRADRASTKWATQLNKLHNELLFTAGPDLKKLHAKVRAFLARNGVK